MIRSNTPSRKRFLPTPALIVALVALFAAMSGAAVALPGKSTVDSGDIVNETIKSKDVKDGKLKTQDVQDETLTRDDLGSTSVRADELGGIHTHSNSTSVGGVGASNGFYQTDSTTATCGAGEQVISGSGHWSGEAANEELFLSEIVVSHGSNAVTVKGGNDSGNTRTLVAVAHCMG